MCVCHVLEYSSELVGNTFDPWGHRVGLMVGRKEVRFEVSSPTFLLVQVRQTHLFLQHLVVGHRM